MTRYLLDTDTFSLYLRGHPGVSGAVLRHISAELTLSIVTVEELWDGWRAVIRRARTPADVGAAYDRLADTLGELRNWPVVSFGGPVVERYAGLKKQKLNVRASDLKIAAIALERVAVLVTHNTRDFARVPGLVLEDWAAGG